jgi:hypothetical protein
LPEHENAAFPPDLGHLRLLWLCNFGGSGGRPRPQRHDAPHGEHLDQRDGETYGKPFTLVQDITVLNTAAAKKALAAAPVKLTGKLEYQACDDKVCYAPTRVPVTFELAVK